MAWRVTVCSAPHLPHFGHALPPPHPALSHTHGAYTGRTGSTPRRVRGASMQNDPNSPSPSYASGAPPQASAQTHSSEQLQAHPLWAAAAGRGRGRSMPPPAARGGRGRGRGATLPPEEDGASTRYERISLLAQELQGGATGGDGADSAFCSDDADSEGERHGVARRRYRDRGDVADEDCEMPDGADDTSALDSSDGEGDDDESPSQRPANHKKSERRRGGTAVDMMAAATFGTHARGCGDVTSDDESQASRTSSKRKRDAYFQAFPVRGVSCVGCALANRIGPVERFVNNNVGRQSEKALWKFAELTWKKEVVEPAKREGVHVVKWPWRDIANHFRLHTTSAVVGRTAMIQTLTAMRCQVEGALVRNDNGERTLDKANAELALKVRSRDPPAAQAPGPHPVHPAHTAADPCR